MEVLPSHFLNVELEETAEDKTTKNWNVSRSLPSSLTISLAPSVPKPSYCRKEEKSQKYSKEARSAYEIDYLDLIKRLPPTVLEECIIELASPKQTCVSTPKCGKDTVIIEPIYAEKSEEWSISGKINPADVRNIFNQVEVVYSDDDEPPGIENGNNSRAAIKTLDALPFACEHCPNKYPNKGALWQHKVASHSVEKSCQCKLCGRRFYRNCSLALHMKCHSDEQNCRCKICGKEFSRLSLLERHAKHHNAEASVTGEATFACKICRKNFNDETTLKAHALSHGEKYTCEQCNVTFTTKQLLNLHFHITHGQSGTAFACKVCGVRFANLRELNEHSLSHTFAKSRMSCHHCGEVFTQRCAYKKHLQLHTSEKLSCTICRIDFTQRSSLLRHYKRMHLLNDIPNMSLDPDSIITKWTTPSPI